MKDRYHSESEKWIDRYFRAIPGAHSQVPSHRQFPCSLPPHGIPLLPFGHKSVSHWQYSP